MRIVHVAQSIAGGIATYFEEIAAYQNNLFGAENVFFVVPNGSEIHLPSIEAKQLITFIGGKRSPSGLVAFGVTVLQAIRQIDPAVIHLHSSFAGGVVRPLLVMKRRRPGIVYCPHGWAFGIETSNFEKNVYASIERFLLRQTDWVIVNSVSERKLGKQFGICADKMRTVINGISAGSEWSPLSRVKGDGPINAAFVGRFDRQKGLDVLLGEIEAVPAEQLHLNVIGAEVLAANNTAEYVHRKNITFHGWLCRSAVFSLLSCMDVLIVPSRWEAFGLVAIEAMRARIAVIASNRGALPEIIRHGVDGYIFDIDKPGELAGILLGLKRSKLQAMGKAGERRFTAKFTADRMNALIADVYKSVSREAKGRPEAEAIGRTERAYAPSDKRRDAVNRKTDRDKSNVA